MYLYLLRHGQSEGNVLRIAGLDPPMTEVGHRQIQRAAERLARQDIAHLYYSPLYRALQTAGIVRMHLGLEPSVDPIFCEIWGTGWEARERKELQAEFPWANLPNSLDKRWWPAVAETAEEILHRAKCALQTLLSKHPGADDRVCLVGHGMFGDALIRQCLGGDPTVSFELLNASMTRIRFSENGQRIILSVNDVSHLPEEMWT